jgi:mRNA interferase RelE/StbE
LSNSNENIDYIVVLSSESKAFFESATSQLQKKLDRCFDRLKIEPYYHPNIKSLKGRLSGYYRYRLGDYRVIYEVNQSDRVVIIVLIGHRARIYE